MATRSTSALVLDDELIVAMDIQMELEQRRWNRICMVHSLQDALTAMRGETFNIAILDVNLPDGNSFELARALIDGGTKVILMSGNAQDLDGESLQKAQFFRKPFMMNQIMDAAANAVNES